MVGYPNVWFAALQHGRPFLKHAELAVAGTRDLTVVDAWR